VSRRKERKVSSKGQGERVEGRKRWREGTYPVCQVLKLPILDRLVCGLSIELGKVLSPLHARTSVHAIDLPTELNADKDRAVRPRSVS
jgi:hypothetical protein